MPDLTLGNEVTFSSNKSGDRNQFASDLVKINITIKNDEEVESQSPQLTLEDINQQLRT